MSFKPLICNHPKEKCFVLENESFQRFCSPKLAWISTRFQRILQLALPHYSSRILKQHALKVLEKPWHLQNIFIKMISNSVCSLFQNVIFQKARLEKCINLN
jgi:hypothetical protein